MVLPPPLRPGSRVAVVAPSFPLETDLLAAARPFFSSLGLTPVFLPSCFARHGWFSGTDRLRAADVRRAFTDPAFDAVFCLRGGYGAARLLPLLDFAELAANPKLFLGYSDITALHLALQNLAGLVTLHGPMVSEFASLRPPALSSLASCLFCRPSIPRSLPLRYILPGTKPAVQGPVVGGSLSVLASLSGTPWQPRLEGCLLFLEDVGEPLYRIDRMLTTLIQAGVLEGCRGILLGSFWDCKPSGRHLSWNYSLPELFRERLAPLGLPAAGGLPFGHHPGALTLPLGLCCRMDAASGLLTPAGAEADGYPPRRERRSPRQ